MKEEIWEGITVRPFAFDDDLLARVKQTGREAVRIYPFSERAVVAGRGSTLSLELNPESIRERRVSLFRRLGGGCSVYLDPGNLIVSIAFPAEGFGNIAPLFDLAGGRLIQALDQAGISGVYKAGISDLVIRDRKVGGSCLYRTRGLAYYSASLLVSPDLETMAACLSHPPREPAYRQGRSHQAFVAGLNHFYPELTPSGLQTGLVKTLDPVAIQAA